MDYSHSDRLEGFRLLYVSLADEQKDLYSVKDQWESLSDDLDEVYFWTAIEDMHQNDLLGIINGLQLAGTNDFELREFNVDNYDELDKVRVPRTWELDSREIKVFTDHFERYDQPSSENYSLGSSVSSLEVSRHVEKGDKSVEYLLENNNEEDEASLRLEVEFNVPSFSSETEEVFMKYANNYLNKLERQEVNTLRRKAEDRTGENQRSAAI